VTFSECYYIYTFAGTGTQGYSGNGGPATSAELNFPFGVAVSSTGEVYIADTWNQRVRVVFTNGTINTFSGNGYYGYSGDGGPATSAELNNPNGVAVSSTSEVYIADSNNIRIRMVVNSTSSQCSDIGYYQNQIYCICANTIMDSCSSCYGENWFSPRICSGLGSCIAYNKCKCFPGIVGYNCNQNVGLFYFIHTFAGNGIMGYYGNGGPATSAELNSPTGVAVSSTGEVYIADSGNNVIRILVDSPSAECSNQGYYQNQSYCICSNGVMNSCSSCYGINSGSSSICSGHGQCVSPNNRSCYSGYTGYECQLISCYGVNQTSSNVCSSHGQCVSPNNCSCESGYTGYECELSICYGVNETSSNVCSGHGQCVSPNNCSCDSGYTGYNCQLISCYGVNQTSSNVCSGHGTCTSLNNCNCTNGFTGEYCQHVSFAMKLVVNFMFLSLIIAFFIV
jgi:hypothetical protein